MAQDKELELIVPLRLATMQRLAIAAEDFGVSKNRMATRLIEAVLTEMNEPLEKTRFNPNGLPQRVENLRRKYL